MATFNPTKDAHIQEAAPTTNLGAATTIRVQATAAAKIRSLLTFDLSSLGAITVASNVTLDLFHVAMSGSNFLAGLSRITQAWIEAEVTWNIYSTGNNWATAGGDFTATGQVTGITIPAGSSADLRISGSLLRDLVQDAIDNQSGILDIIIHATEDVTGIKQFGSSENGNAGLHPLLTVNEGNAGGGARRSRMSLLGIS
jgi:hypothetical protein